MKTLLSRLNENDKKREYSCLMTSLPTASVAADILRYSLSIPDKELYDNEPGFGRELDVHSTIKYGLETEDPTVIQNLLKDTNDAQPFQITLGKVSLFTKDDKPYDVVKIDVHSPGIVKLHKLFSTLPNGDENPNYIPHMTLAYVKKGEGKKYEGEGRFVGKEFEVDTLIFSDHSGNKTKIELPNNEDLEESINEAWKDHPDPSGFMRAAHDPKNCLLVWWYNPYTGLFVKSQDPNYHHGEDVRQGNIKISELKTTVRGRVFEFNGYVYLMAYHISQKRMTEGARLILLDNAQNSITPGKVITRIIDDRGDNIGELFESYPQVLDKGVFTLNDSKLNEQPWIEVNKDEVVDLKLENHPNKEKLLALLKTIVHDADNKDEVIDDLMTSILALKKNGITPEEISKLKESQEVTLEKALIAKWSKSNAGTVWGLGDYLVEERRTEWIVLDKNDEAIETFKTLELAKAYVEKLVRKEGYTINEGWKEIATGAALAGSLIGGVPNVDAATHQQAGQAVHQVRQDMDSATKQKIDQLKALATKEDIQFKVTQGYRSQDQQNKLYNQGRTTSGKVVTWTKNSEHTKGDAFDVAIIKDGKITWEPKEYTRLGQLGKSIGLTWGGDWKNKDLVHFQMRPVLSPTTSTPKTPQPVSAGGIVAKVLAGEAGGAGREGMLAVANVIQNRGGDPSKVVTKPNQFSAYKDPELMNRNYSQVKAVADDVASKIGTLKDNTNGATHYTTRAYYIKHAGDPHSWVSKMTVTKRIGDQIFMKERH